ncbi:hypothetical protein QY049_35695, partial [Bradyrhizobium sp. WYCCWR 13022]|uniref:hypothetical protein n=1 Tax=unclassified Bradyrhizobium TaxID=2631580 RepID=UPI00263B46B3
MVNQKQADLGIPNRFRLNPSRFRGFAAKGGKQGDPDNAAARLDRPPFLPLLSPGEFDATVRAAVVRLH